MKKIVNLLIASVLSLVLCAQQAAQEPPYLVVGITVNGLRSECINRFHSSFGKGGFNKLINQGVYYQQAGYPYLAVDAVTDAVSMATASQPYTHGVSGAQRYDRDWDKYKPVFSDPAVRPLASGKSYSAAAVQSTTWTDELNEQYYGQTRLVSLAMNAADAIAQAGHSGQVWWLDMENGVWNSSSYYGNALPEWMRGASPVTPYLEKTWEPLYPVGYYQQVAGRKQSFRYRMADLCKGKQAYSQFACTPFANNLVCETALKAVDQYQMGKDRVPDALLLNLSVGLPDGLPADAGSLEEEDIYLRLDRCLQDLLTQLEAKVGKSHLLVYLLASRTEVGRPGKALNAQLPGQAFSIDKYSALLNSYLMAHFGQARWVLSAQNGHIYLNRKLIDEKNIDLTAVQQKALEFFYTIPGIRNVASSVQLEQSYFAFGSLTYAYSRQQSGDLLYSLLPGWWETRQGISTGYRTANQLYVPLYLYGWSIPVQTAREQVSVLSLANSLATWLGIPPPSGSRGERLPLQLP